jgi:hypothetical protein
MENERGSFYISRHKLLRNICQIVLSSKPKAGEKDGRKYAVIFLLPYFIKRNEIDFSQNMLQIDSNIC